MHIGATGASYTTEGRRRIKHSYVTSYPKIAGFEKFKGHKPDKAAEQNSDKKAIKRAIIASVIGIPVIAGSLLLLAPVLPAIATGIVAFLGVAGLAWAIGVPQMKPNCPGRSEEEASVEAKRAKA